ncbi:DUF6682 family protein [Polaromonas sp.]|uniref:phage adaptor protein n=1 Tax=Polaromonas sp. TaxID=1869339 RepID=UPI00326558E7
MLASQVIDSATELLQDEGNVRWVRADLLGWLNDGQLQVVVVRPDAKTFTGPLALVAGPLQAISSGGLRLLDVTRNVGGRAITLITRQQLNDLNTAWFTTTGKTAIKHYMFDDRFPKEFHCYPPAAVGASVEARWSAVPVPCVAETDVIDLDDTYKSALVDYICYRAFLRDSEAPSSLARSNAFLQSFMLSLTGKTNADQAAKPKRDPA